MPHPNHLVKTVSEIEFETPLEFGQHSTGYTGDTVVDEMSGAVQMGFRVSQLEGGGQVDAHVHSFEETVYIINGELVADLPGGSHLLVAGDYGLLPVAMPHAFRNESSSQASFVEMKAPLPRTRFDLDTYFVERLVEQHGVSIDVRDPRTRAFGHIDRENMDPAMQTQESLALSASMRTALLVYSGISVKMMIDSELGADLSVMFMVQYEPGGFAGVHDHPLEEAYLVLEGEVEASFDDEVYRLGAGDFAWAGVGCVHGFRNLGAGPVRWLETQAPQPPKRHSYRFRRDWTYLENALTSRKDRHD